MRIIAGRLKGREIKSPRGHKTHPMSDKMRGALFNVLGDINGLSFLDAFAGSGALAFEAASRGAKAVTAIDRDSSAHKAMEQNAKELGLESIRVVRANTGGWSMHNIEQKFDILLLDPPYEELQLDLAERLIKRHLNAGGLAVLSFPGKAKPEKLALSEIIALKNYGDSQLVFYRKLK
jgi:16S rRNA (guanine966-N2)-methyltransferase